MRTTEFIFGYCADKFSIIATSRDRAITFKASIDTDARHHPLRNFSSTNRHNVLKAITYRTTRPGMTVFR